MRTPIVLPNMRGTLAMASEIRKLYVRVQALEKQNKELREELEEVKRQPFAKGMLKKALPKPKELAG